MLLNEKLRMLRKQNNLTQEELAEKLNVSRQAITKWESGDGTPDIENIKQISLLFDIKIDELVKEDETITIKDKNQFSFLKELEIDHTKHFDIKICEIQELNLMPNDEEKVKIKILSDEENIEESFKIIFDDLYNRLDIDIKSIMKNQNISINMYIPEKYIDEIELNSKMKTLNISNLTISQLEYDGDLKYLNVKSSSGNIELNTTKCDIEANYDKFEGRLEVNTINSTARVEIPKDTKYKTVLKGMKNEFIDAINTEDSNNIIELNGMNSKLIVIEK